ncbi:SEL1-like repeat protein [Paraliomyxa miuraensis]|uniref:hypothetical protein n=1 Tax=Paraliomyxa miuraensis TaxID=376150 RepID=UPI002252BE0E|nr:hypothetical protein [Paraliomyxa miuraensis]MCX4241443.1 hypothetical protein [Paraliomyxa miuraensis]
MRTSIVSRCLVPSLLVLAVGGLTSCKGWIRPWSQAPEIVERSWQVETVLVETGADALGTPSVFLDHEGRPQVVLVDRAFTVGVQSIALARRRDEGWRVEVPLAPASWRTCGRAAEDGAVVITYGELEGELEAVRWDGISTGPAEPGPCPRPRADLREAAGAGGTHTLERSRDGRTLWHQPPSGRSCQPLDAAPEQRIDAYALALAGDRPVVALFERPAGDESAVGRLRHAVCGDDGWTSSIVAEGVRVTEVGLVTNDGGHSHVAYVAVEGTRARLVHAFDGVADGGGSATVAKDRDARVEPGLEACMRLWPAPPPAGGVERYQQGDALRCAVLGREASVSQQAIEVATERCDGGQARACAVAGSLHHWLMGDVTLALELSTDGTTRFTADWRGLRAAVSEDLVAAGMLYGRACELGDARACLHHATLLSFEDPRRLERATTACQGGLPHGCALALAAAHLRPDQTLATTAESALRSACEGGDAVACNDLGVMLHGRGDASAARASLHRACEERVAIACTNLERLQVTGQ